MAVNKIVKFIDLGTELLQERIHGGNVGKNGHVGQRDGLVGEQTGADERQSGIFCAADKNLSLKALAASDFDFIHGLFSLQNFFNKQ